MNLGLRLALTFIAWFIYWLLPAEIIAIWVGYLVIFFGILALRNLKSALISSILLLTLLLLITLYQIQAPNVFYKLWFSPFIALSFLDPDLNRSSKIGLRSNAKDRHRELVSLTGFSTLLGNGVFQVLHGILFLMYGTSKRHLIRHIHSATPTIILPLLWLILGLVVRGFNGTGMTHLATASSWIWAPILCFIFVRLSTQQVSLYLKGLALGLITSASFGLAITLLNPSVTHPLIEPLVSLGSLHQAMQPGQPDTLAASGFFFHRLKFAHVSVLVLPVLWLLSRRAAYIGLALVVTALFCSYASWAAVTFVGLATVSLTFKLWLPRSITLYLSLILSCVLGMHAFISTQPTRSAELIAKSPSLTTRQFMAKEAIDLIVEQPLGLGHGGFKHWSLTNYPKTLNNRQLPRTLPHNIGLSALVETGFVGWALMVGLMSYLLTLSLKAFEMVMPANREVLLLSAIVGCATLVLLGLGLLHDPLYHKPVAFSWMLIVALGHRLRALHSM